MAKKKVFVTKYALTGGIKECEVKEKERESAYVYVKWPGGLNGENMFSSKECHDTLEEAKAYADEMRLKKIFSLKKQIEKLEALKF